MPEDDEFELNATINTTPLVDVMLVLLIIFLIAVPVVVSAHAVELPKEQNVAKTTTLQDVSISVDGAGKLYWGTAPLAGEEEMFALLVEAVSNNPQTECHIRGDASARYEYIGRVLDACQRAGIARVAFITLPEPGAAAAGGD
jgi:biopolymer transport protein ExbD